MENTGDTIIALEEVIEFCEEKRVLTLRTECRKHDGTFVLDGEAEMLLPAEGEQV